MRTPFAASAATRLASDRLLALDRNLAGGSLGKPANGQTRIPPVMQPWIEARKRFRLSHAHVQMARELGLNPNKLGKLANHDREPWKQPLPDFIVTRYRKHFGRERPGTVRSIEEMAAAKEAKKQAKKEAKAARR